MDLIVDGRRAHAATGGATFDPARACVVFLHGAGLDHTVWALAARWFAQKGRGVLAVDLPGHGLSEGPPLAAVEAMADWLWRLLDAAAVAEAVLVGFSMGSAVALEAAARAPGRTRALALAGVAETMAVHPRLMELAEADDHRAFELMAAWSHDATGHLGGQPAPGLWVMGGSLRLLERSAPGVLAFDLKACDSYKGARAAATAVSCPTLLIVGEHDAMTPALGATALAESFADVETVLLAGCGHMIIGERPNETLDALARVV